MIPAHTPYTHHPSTCLLLQTHDPFCNMIPAHTPYTHHPSTCLLLQTHDPFCNMIPAHTPCTHHPPTCLLLQTNDPCTYPLHIYHPPTCFLLQTITLLTYFDFPNFQNRKSFRIIIHKIFHTFHYHLGWAVGGWYPACSHDITVRQ